MRRGQFHHFIFKSQRREVNCKTTRRNWVVFSKVPGNRGKHWGYIYSHGSGHWIFDRLKNLTRQFVLTKPFNIFALLTRKCRINFNFCQRFYPLPLRRALLHQVKRAKGVSPSLVTKRQSNRTFAVQNGRLLWCSCVRLPVLFFPFFFNWTVPNSINAD